MFRKRTGWIGTGGYSYNYGYGPRYFRSSRLGRVGGYPYAGYPYGFAQTEVGTLLLAALLI